MTLPEPRPIEWPPPSAVEVIRRARTAAEEILAAAEAEAAKLRTESAALRAEVETAAYEAERRCQQAVDERGRVAVLLEEEVVAGRQAVRLSQERAALLTEEADELLARARDEADRLITEARETARAADAEKSKLSAAWKEVQERAAGITAEAVARGKAEADQYLAAARKEAARTTSEAESVAKGLLRSASAEAQQTKDDARRFREELGERASKKAKWDKQIDEWSPRVALTAVVGLTATGEFQLAQLAGWPATIAWMLPLGIDVYVVQAMRRHRDVAPALILMVAANAIFHLAAVGLFGARVTPHGASPEWWLIVGVAAIAPFVMWRIHRITAPPKERRTRHRRERQGRVPEPRQKAVICAGPKGLLPLCCPENLAPVVAISRAVSVARTSTTGGPSGAKKELLAGANPAASKRQDEAPTGASETVKKPASKRVGLAPTRRQRPGRPGVKKTTPMRRSLDEWVEVATPVFHSEFARLRRNPTANEFATAIAKAGHGAVSDSTAKNIRAEILDRTELPAID